ncbi:hypothetical protein [Streptomyces sp. S.PB5]|uniref:hypothetical protein n=1 Tax=Streptomyces sp. S.PB5 TaxID=3020844 RepID=UPI0025B244FE|nr:hypothetical protein [Streptomyces sp. S.PB5]MDN3027464.1 hypothetical protein [Streptomyces sp. S.PB5]
MADHFSGPRILSDPASDVAGVFTFATPGRIPGSDEPLQLGTCTTSNDEQVLFLAADATQKLALRPGADNVLEGMNVLSIVVEVDPEVVFGLDRGPCSVSWARP